jgi:hypothetical protein
MWDFGLLILKMARKGGMNHGVTRMATDKRYNHEGHEAHEGDYEIGSLKSSIGSP